MLLLSPVHFQLLAWPALFFFTVTTSARKISEPQGCQLGGRKEEESNVHFVRGFLRGWFYPFWIMPTQSPPVLLSMFLYCRQHDESCEQPLQAALKSRILHDRSLFKKQKMSCIWLSLICFSEGDGEPWSFLTPATEACSHGNNLFVRPGGPGDG